MMYLEKTLSKFIGYHVNALYSALLVNTPIPELDVTVALRAPSCRWEQAHELVRVSCLTGLASVVL